MDYKQLKELFCRHECEHPETHLTAYITFSSFGPKSKNDYDWKGRTYAVSSDNKAFQPNKGGYSIFGYCLDGTDQGVRLEQHMREEHGGDNGWIVADCCIVGYLLASCHKGNIMQPEIFYSHAEAHTRMLYHLAQESGLNFEQLKADSAHQKLTSADTPCKIEKNRIQWLDQETPVWNWSIQAVRIYSPLHIAFGHE